MNTDYQCRCGQICPDDAGGLSGQTVPASGSGDMPGGEALVARLLDAFEPGTFPSEADRREMGSG